MATKMFWSRLVKRRQAEGVEAVGGDFLVQFVLLSDNSPSVSSAHLFQRLYQGFHLREEVSLSILDP
jgi:hypothetical protein